MQEANCIRLMIVEDDPDWLRGLTALLAAEPDLRIVATADSAEGARRVLAALTEQPDVVLLDIMLSGQSEGITLAEHIGMRSSARIIMLTSMEENRFIFDSFQAGAADYILKSRFEEIPGAIRAAFRRSSPISAGVAEQLREEFRRLQQLEATAKTERLRALLTTTEWDILRRIAQDRTQPEIARELYISIRTVKVHVGHILRKLEVKSSKDAVQLVARHGLLDF